MFWSPRAVRVENNVSQARDFLAIERNFFVGTRAAFAVVVAASAILFTREDEQTWIDWTLAGLMLFLAAILPITMMLNYVQSFNAFCAEDAKVHNSWWLIAVMLGVAGSALLVAARNYTVS